MVLLHTHTFYQILDSLINGTDLFCCVAQSVTPLIKFGNKGILRSPCNKTILFATVIPLLLIFL